VWVACIVVCERDRPLGLELFEEIDEGISLLPQKRDDQ
jgi:hypothetical protein